MTRRPRRRGPSAADRPPKLPGPAPCGRSRPDDRRCRERFLKSWIRSSSEVIEGPGRISSTMISAIAGCAAILRTNFTAASISATSSLGRKRIGDDLRIVARVLRADHDFAAAGRAAVGEADRKAGPRVRRQDRPLAGLRDDGREGLEIKLHVRPVQRRIGAEEAAGIVHRQRQRAACAGRHIACRPEACPTMAAGSGSSVGSRPLKV